MQATNLKTNHLTQPLGIDAGTLFLSWQCAEGVRQTAYEIEVTAGAETLWASGKILSSVMRTETPTPVPPKTQGQWRIRLWDENDQPGAWSEAVFETGLPFADWQGVWVCPETEEPDIDCTDAINAFAKPNWEQKQAALEASGKGQAQPYQPHHPASYLRKGFTAPAGGSKRLYITAKGLYTAWLNGKRIGDMVLAPGSFTADKHLGVQTYDVAALVREGENELLIALGDGWYRSTSGVDGDRDLFGKELAVLFQLEVDGKAVCVSDDAMEATQCGPIRQNDLQQGEVYDARLEGELTGWHGVRTAPNTLPLIGMNTVPIREQETFTGRLFRTPNGETVLDFGQNMAGYVEMKLTAHEGQKIHLLCGETLDENGNFTQENFQDRNRHKEGGTAQLLELICKEGENHYKPSFTIMGFRYAKVETDIDLTGAECRLNQYPDGRMANIAPPTSRPGYMTPMLCMSAGWGDAAILVPYALYQRTGDRKILADNYEMMQKWYAFLLGRAQQTTEEQQTGEYAKYTVLNGLDYGEWCEPGITPMQAMMNPRKSVGTAYLAYSGRLLAEIAVVLGKPEEAVQYRDTAEKARLAYRAAFTDHGKITSDRQCEYVRAIAFGLLDEAESQTAADQLNQMVLDNGCHLNTGFLSTPFLCKVLAEHGHTDTAYKLLLQDTAPSWLYEVKQGATTVWETWTGIDTNGHPSESLNHYSYGAICGWLFGGVCGIHLAGQTLTIAPTPNPALGWAKAVYDSPVGRIESGWQYAGDAVTYTITVPCNLTAEVALPDGRKLTLQPGTHTL